MSRHLAHHLRSYQVWVAPRPFSRSRQDYLRTYWTYRQQRASYPQHPLGYGLTLVPYGWHNNR